MGWRGRVVNSESEERVTKGLYLFRVRHASTARLIVEDCHCRPSGPVEEHVAAAARIRLRVLDIKRVGQSKAFADGKAVPDAPALPAPMEPSRAAGQLEIAAALPVAMIRDAYARVKGSLHIDPAAPEKAALALGRQVLIGATDEQILKIARGEATLTGSLRTGVVYAEIAA